MFKYKKRDIFTNLHRQYVQYIFEKRGPNGKFQRTTKFYYEIIKLFLYMEIKVHFIIRKNKQIVLVKIVNIFTIITLSSAFGSIQFLCAVHIFKSGKLFDDP